MKHIVTLSIVIFSLTQMSNAHPCGQEQARYGYERVDSLTNALITVTISLDNAEHQVPLLDADMVMPVPISRIRSQNYLITNYLFASVANKDSVKNNSP